MPNTIEELLTEIDQKMALGQREEPERLLLQLINQLGRERIAEWRQDLLKIVHQFHRKRRANLLAAIDEALAVDQPGATARPTIGRPFVIDPTSDVVRDFRIALDELADEHIFQWSTYYKDYLATHSDQLFHAMKEISPDDKCEVLVELLSDHAYDIFTRGYSYVIKSSDPTPPS